MDKVKEEGRRLLSKKRCIAMVIQSFREDIHTALGHTRDTPVTFKART
jgi:hypothetical protein